MQIQRDLGEDARPLDLHGHRLSVAAELSLVDLTNAGAGYRFCAELTEHFIEIGHAKFLSQYVVGRGTVKGRDGILQRTQLQCIRRRNDVFSNR